MCVCVHLCILHTYIVYTMYMYIACMKGSIHACSVCVVVSWWCLLSCSATKIFVNGCWVGIHREPELLMTTLQRLRRQMDIIVSEVTYTCIHVRM